MIKGQVEVYSNFNSDNSKLLFSENNLIVDGMGELIATMMTLPPNASSAQTSSLYDTSNYTIHAISFGKAGSEYFYNAHANFGPALYGRNVSSQVWVSANTSSYTPKLFVPKTASPIDTKLVSFENIILPEESGNYTFQSNLGQSSGFLNIWERDQGGPVTWNDTSIAGFSGFPSNINELRFKDVRINRSGLLTLDLNGNVSSFRSNSNTALGPQEFEFNPSTLGSGCLQIYTINADDPLDGKLFFAITSAGNVSSWNSPNSNNYFRDPAPTHAVCSISIAHSAKNAIALYQNGTVSAWDRYSNPLYAIQAPPTSIQGSVKKIGSTGYHHIALLNDNSVCAWGSNHDTSTTELSSLYIYEANTDIVDINFAFSLDSEVPSIGTIVDSNGNVKIFGASATINSIFPTADLANNISQLNNVSSIFSNHRSSIVLFKNGTVSAYGIGMIVPAGSTPWNTRFRNGLDASQGQFSKIKITTNPTLGFISYTTTGGIFSGTSFGILNNNTNASSLESNLPVAAFNGRVRDWYIADTGTGFAVLTDNTVSSWGYNGTAGYAYIPPGIQGITSSIVITSRDRLALLTNGQVSSWVPSGQSLNQHYVSYTSAVPVSVNGTGINGNAIAIGLASVNADQFSTTLNPSQGAVKAYAIINSPQRNLISWGFQATGLDSRIPQFDQAFSNTYFINKIEKIYSSPGARHILFESKTPTITDPNPKTKVYRYPSYYYTNSTLSAVDLSSMAVGSVNLSLPSSFEPSRKKITSAIDFDTGLAHALFIGSEGYVSSWYPFNSPTHVPFLRYANPEVKNKIWRSVSCGKYSNYAMSSTYDVKIWGTPSLVGFDIIPRPNNNNPRYDKLRVYSDSFYAGIGLYTIDVLFTITEFLSGESSILNNVNFKQNVNLLPFVGKTVNKLNTPQGQIPIIVSSTESLLEGCYAPSGGQIVKLVSGISPYTMITSASLSGTFNTLGNMDHRGFVNKTSTQNPASGLVVSSNSSLSSTGEIVCVIKIHKDDCAFTNLFGGITQLGIWGYDILKNLSNEKYPPYQFSTFPEQSGIYVTPNEYKLLAKKVFHDNILKVADNGANAGLNNHADLTILWKLYFV